MATFPSSSDVKANRQTSDRIITVTEPADGGQFNSIKEAIDHADASMSPTPADPVVVEVGKGDYAEDPMTLPDDIYVVGEDKELVKITPTTPASPVITDTGTGGKKGIEGVTIEGGTKAVEVGSPTEKMTIKEVKVIDQTDTAIEANNPNAFVKIESVEVRVETTAPTNLVRATGGAKVEGTGIKAEVGAGVTVTNGFVSDAGSDLQVKDSSIKVEATGTVGRGVYADQGIVDMRGNVEIDSAAVGVWTTDNSDSKVVGDGLRVKDSSVRDIYMAGGKTSSAEVSTIGSFWDGDKVNAYAPGYKAIANKPEETDAAGVDYKINQTLAATKGTATGESTSQEDFFVFTNDNGEIGTWADESAVAKNPVGTFTLPGLGVGNAIYFGSTDERFGALQLAVQTPKIEGPGILEHQYWDGGSWVQTPQMTHKLTPPYDRHADETMTVAEYQTVQVDQEVMAGTTGWAKKLLNGENAFWHRFIVTTAPITQAPLLRRARLQQSLCIRDQYGKRLAHGSGREQVRELLSDYRLPAAGGPTLITKPLSPNISVYEPIEHPPGADTELTLEWLLDSKLDTASGVGVGVLWAPTTGNLGNVLWRLISLKIRKATLGSYNPSIVDGVSIPDVIDNKIVAVGGVADLVQVTLFDKIDVQKFSFGDKLVLSLRRIGTGDTYLDPVHRLGVWVTYHKAFGGE